ncbi:VOC family protein [Pararcticibacter amylolyticus]|uniref:Lactoylglutathione lyase n=1 Tax=Pararcticibacter amylolyticus TaxID=2173175 RepID=A0A2U2PKU2_9SPHI|nr:VOC family protein [Pararcticibacter amylolyticus]PWG82021.1 lactoylglutathione lyase [Pararcticibacter amylolyticus]
MKCFEFILYVADQERSTEFYRQLFQQDPVLNVPGMTEFEPIPGCKLGLMPERGIAKIIGGKTPDPASGSGIPRCEIYLLVEDIQPYYERAQALSAVRVSDIGERNWGHRVCYFADADGHILAFAEEM